MNAFINIKNRFYKIGESNRIGIMPEYGHSRYLRNHKFYKKISSE